MSLLSIKQIRKTIDVYSPIPVQSAAAAKQAAVSVILKSTGDHTEALFILRATKDGDPWSGHMAFPGGHFEAGDASLRHTAERETWEEIGLDLVAHGNFLGEIDAVHANPRGRTLDMVVTPFVYELTTPDVSFNPNYEVANVMWGSLNDMHSGDSHTMGEFLIAGEKLSYPGYGVEDEVVWGLTYRMVDQFFAMLDPAWVSRD
jgi:8-oxo-dGTP pyrophosphatase MutT (NUDIX family)